MDEVTPPLMKKRDFLDSPLNMSMGRSPLDGVPKTPDFMPRTPDIKMSPWMKEEKKKKEKAKKEPKKPKAPQLMQQHHPQSQSPLMPYFNQPPNLTMGGMNLPFPQQPHFPFFAGLMPTGPGLIPNNPFMPGPSFGASPFGLPGTVPNPAALSNLFPGPSRMRIDDMQQQQQPLLAPPHVEKPPPLVEKPHCNVAPLLPEPTPSTSNYSSILKLPPDTVAIPMEVPMEIEPNLVQTPQAPPPPQLPQIQAVQAADDFDTIDLTSPNSAKSDKKKDKEHKKERKDKDKLKKKKKQKDKDREKPEKEKVKKHKKEKKKDKERLEATKILSSNTDSVDASDSSIVSVPKLTLKLGLPGSRSSTPDVPKKM